jgi:predicted ATP-grasp superfamily ATP-dependent carboligase
VLVDLGYTGTCFIDYMLDSGGAKLLEINPRFGGSLAGDINRYLGAYLSSLEEPTLRI